MRSRELDTAPGEQPFAVAVAGSLSLDRIVRGGESRRRLGGVVTYAGLTYRSLGLETRAAFRLAPADHAHLAPLEAAGMRLFTAPSAETTVFVNHVSGEQRRQELRGRAAPLRAEDLRPAVAGARLVHLGPLHPDDIDPAALHTLRGRGLTVALDVQGLTRRVDADGAVRPAVAATALQFLRHADFVKASEDELALLVETLGRTPLDLVAEHGIRELIETAGSRGGRIHAAAGVEPYAAVPLAASGDPTGAGDVFFAAYLAARVARGADRAEAARAAAACATRMMAGELLPIAGLELAPE